MWNECGIGRGYIEEHSRCGLSVLDFCKEREIASTSFYQWRTKLKQGAEPATPALVPVKLVGTAPEPPALGLTNSSIELLAKLCQFGLQLCRPLFRRLGAFTFLFGAFAFLFGK